MNTEVQVVAWTRRYAFSLSPAEEGRASLSAPVGSSRNTRPATLAICFRLRLMTSLCQLCSSPTDQTSLDAGLLKGPGKHRVGRCRGGEWIVVRAALDHQTDLDHDVPVIPIGGHGLQIANVVHVAFAGNQELVMGRDATLVLDVRVRAIRCELGNHRLHIHALHIEVADI